MDFLVKNYRTVYKNNEYDFVKEEQGWCPVCNELVLHIEYGKKNGKEFQTTLLDDVEHVCEIE